MLIGLSGAGKSEVAPLVAARLGLEAVDLDARVERAAGATVSKVIETRGEPAFRALEAEALRSALLGPDARAGGVLALGAGALGSEDILALLRERSFVVWLQVEPGTAARRLGASGAETRPLVRDEPERRLRGLLEARRVTYRGAAHAIVDTEGRGPVEVAEAVAVAWETRSRWGSSAS